MIQKAWWRFREASRGADCLFFREVVRGFFGKGAVRSTRVGIYEKKLVKVI